MLTVRICCCRHLYGWYTFTVSNSIAKHYTAMPQQLRAMPWQEELFNSVLCFGAPGLPLACFGAPAPGQQLSVVV